MTTMEIAWSFIYAGLGLLGVAVVVFLGVMVAAYLSRYDR